MTATAVLTLREAIVGALEASTVLQGGKVYHEGDVRRDAVLPYAVLGTWAEPGDSRRTYGQDGASQVGQVKFWGKDSHDAQLAFQDGKARLDGVTLTLTGHRTVGCRLGYLADFAEPNPDVGGHVVVGQLRTRTLVGT